MNKLKLAYFGTPDFSAKLLEKLITDKSLPIEIKLVVTQPDKPVGRNQTLTPSPVKLMAQKYGIKVIDDIENCKLKIVNSDLALLFAYGEIIPATFIDIMPDIWVIHPSPLPYYRGPSPTAYPLIFGDKFTGITIFKMDEKVDHGPIIAREKIEIFPSETRQNLTYRLSYKSYELFKKTILYYITNGLDSIRASKQDNEKATYTRLLTKQDGFIPLPVLKKALNNEPLAFDELPKILKEHYSTATGSPRSPDLVGIPRDDINTNRHCEQSETRYRTAPGEAVPLQKNSAQTIFNYFRGLYPWPGIWTKVNINGVEKRLKITDVNLKDNKLFINQVQLEAKNEVDFTTFNKAYKIF